jgi:hypothetical protein
VGGDSVPDGKYKFMAALRDVTRGNTSTSSSSAAAPL